MARFLFAVPPFAGHVNPTIALAAALTGRDHETAWTGIPGLVEELLPPGSRFLAAAADEMGPMVDSLREQFRGLRGPAALKFLWYDVLLPMARITVDGVLAATEAYRPDVLVVDQHALAGAVVARKLDLPWATLASTSAELVDPLAAWPVVATALHQARVQLQLDAGMPTAVATVGDLLFSPSLVVAFTTTALVGTTQQFPEHYQFVGPSTTGRIETTPFPWSWLDDTRPGVLVSLGTVNVREGQRFFAIATEALRSLPVQAVIVAPPELVPDPPANVLVCRQVPQLALLRKVRAVVSHAGHNTVCESLAAGLPLVVAPIRTDQPVVADQVVRAGCGVRVRFDRVDVAGLRSAIERVLNDSDLRAAADAVRRSFTAAPGPAGAAAHLEKLACHLARAA